MTLASKSRESLAIAVSLALGLTVAGALKIGFLLPSAAPVVAKGHVREKPASVRVRSKVAPAATAAVLPKIEKTQAAPLPKSRPPVREVPVQSESASAERDVPPAPPPRIDVAPSLALVQPALLVPPVAAMPDAQLMPALAPAPMVEAPPALTVEAPAAGDVMGRPDAPPDDYLPPPKTFVEQPGGEVLVLGLLLDSTGRVLDMQILVPSYNVAGDTTYAMAVLKNDRFTGIEPPIPEGQSRWIETRVYYPKRNILP